MCYHLNVKVKNQLKRAKEVGALNQKEVEETAAKQSNYDHISGFNHPQLLVYPNTTPFTPIPMTWGLIPHWVKLETNKLKLWNATLNCRGESMFEKPSFKDSASEKRCLVYIDGFYEYHHHKGKKYPFYIHLKNNDPICLAGLWSEWINSTTGRTEQSFTLVTTKGNEMLSKIHNNPKVDGPRMPVILSKKNAEQWINMDITRKALIQLIRPYPDKEMKAYTVGQLLGKEHKSNSSTILKPVSYDALLPNDQRRAPELFD